MPRFILVIANDYDPPTGRPMGATPHILNSKHIVDVHPRVNGQECWIKLSTGEKLVVGKSIDELATILREGK